ncbi:MAG: hypothetical protein ACI9BK_003371, partial [Acidimicrobiales bacterium]
GTFEEVFGDLVCLHFGSPGGPVHRRHGRFPFIRYSRGRYQRPPIRSP